MFHNPRYKVKDKLNVLLENIENDKYDKEETIEEASFTRQHYQAVADILSQYVGKGDDETISAITSDLADMFAEDNPRFARDKFMQAAGVKTESEEAEDEDTDEEEPVEECGEKDVEDGEEEMAEMEDDEEECVGEDCEEEEDEEE